MGLSDEKLSFTQKGAGVKKLAKLVLLSNYFLTGYFGIESEAPRERTTNQIILSDIPKASTAFS